MKTGIECEGRLKGIQTAFIDSNEIHLLQEHFAQNGTAGLGHVYVSYSIQQEFSDHQIKQLVEAFPGMLITADVAYLTGFCAERHPAVTVMLNVDKAREVVNYHGGRHSLYRMVANLDADDQVKFTVDQNVLVTSKRNFAYTSPAEFRNDVEIPIPEKFKSRYQAESEGQQLYGMRCEQNITLASALSKHNAIKFFTEPASDATPMLEISEDKFIVRGVEVPQTADEAKAVYDAFTQWLSETTHRPS